MLSKYMPWDFLGKHPHVIDSQKSGINAFFIEDPFLEKIIKDKIKTHNVEFRYFSGSEISKAFLEEQFLNLSFFSSGENLFILNAEGIANDVLEFLVNGELDFSHSHVLLFFSKLSKAQQEIFKKSKSDLREIEMPRFWEGQKILQFCMKEKKVQLAIPIQQFILTYLEHSFENFLWVIDLISVNFAPNEMSLDALKELIQRERFDFFELLEVFHADKKKYFSIIETKSQDFEWIRHNATSMQTHLVKLLHPEDIAIKGKLSKYDQNILNWSEKINQSEILEDLNFFMSLEIEAKSKNLFLKEKIRLKLF